MGLIRISEGPGARGRGGAGGGAAGLRVPASLRLSVPELGPNYSRSVPHYFSQLLISASKGSLPAVIAKDPSLCAEQAPGTPREAARAALTPSHAAAPARLPGVTGGASRPRSRSPRARAQACGGPGAGAGSRAPTTPRAEGPAPRGAGRGSPRGPLTPRARAFAWVLLWPRFPVPFGAGRTPQDWPAPLLSDSASEGRPARPAPGETPAGP